MFNIISDFEVGRPSHHSDHCPLTLHLKKENTSQSHYNNESLPYKNQRDKCETKSHLPIWNKDSEEKISKYLQSQDFLRTINSISSNLNNSPSTIDAVVEMFTQLLQKSVFECHRRKKTTTNCRFPKNKWFDKQCKEKKRVVHKLAKEYHRNCHNQKNKRRVLERKINIQEDD